LFYNKIIAFDDYKPEFSASRKNYFSFIDFIDPNDFKNTDVMQRTYKIAEDYYPVIKGGQISSASFSNMMALLNMNIQCTWDISSSIYYLNLKMLGNDNSEEKERYRTLCNLMFSQLGEKTNEKPSQLNRVLLFDRYGKEITEGYHIPKAKWGDGTIGGLSSGLNAFIASLNWISFRSIYYSEFAEYLKADAFLHPIRQKFQISYFKDRNKYDVNYIMNILEMFSENTTSSVNTLLNSSRSYNICLKLPLFIASFISKVSDPKKIIEFALECRNQNYFINAREQLGVIQNMFDEGKYDEANKNVQDIKKALVNTFNDIYRKFGISTSQGDLVSKTISSFNSVSGIFKLPQIPDHVKDMKIISDIKSLFPKKSFAFIYKDLLNDLTNVAKLGKYHEQLTQYVDVDKDKPVFQPKFESPKFVNCHSEWKSPM
jgi:hypothetical protein